jgi:hypothetical protein
METMELAQDRTVAERQRRYRQKLKEQGVQLVKLPLDKEARDTLDRLLERRGYGQSRQQDRSREAGKIVREALALVEANTDGEAVPAEPEPEPAPGGDEKAVAMERRPGGGYDITIHGTYVGFIQRGTYKGRRGWEGETPDGQQVGGQTTTSAAKRLAQAAGIRYPG